MIVLEMINVSRSLKRALKKRNKMERHWRPTVAAMVTDKAKSKILFVTHDDTEFWGPPKGGFEESDRWNERQAAYRELFEELNLHRHDILSSRYICSVQDEERENPRGELYEIGKRMHCVQVVIRPHAKPHPDREHHVSDCRWLSSWKDFEELPMTDYRKKMWRLVLQKLGMNWRQQS